MSVSQTQCLVVIFEILWILHLKESDGPCVSSVFVCVCLCTGICVPVCVCVHVQMLVFSMTF